VRPCSLPEQKDGKLASFWGASFNENMSENLSHGATNTDIRI
jgi:hypothetical protein